MPSKWEEMKDIAQNDLVSLIDSEKSYGDSWKQRGGTGAFMMLARKWDRLENKVEEFDRIEQQAKSVNWDIFEASHSYPGEEGVLDDIGDLRRYLLLVEHHVRFAGEPASIEFQPRVEDE